MKELFAKKRRKLGIALGSGGAKGMAHLGVLQLFEEENIRFDVIAGTSIGSIVGALYARGYSSADIGELLAATDYKNMLLSVLASGAFIPLRNKLDDVLGESEFSELSKPFAAIATDIACGEQVVLREGNVAAALLASSAMPPYFKSVNIGGKMLIDGAFTNAVPADVVSSMGADFVIGVSLSPAETYCERTFMTASGRKTVKQNGVFSCDVLLQPDLSAFSAGDVLYGPQMYDIGYDCAKKALPEIVRALKNKK